MEVDARGENPVLEHADKSWEFLTYSVDHGAAMAANNPELIPTASPSASGDHSHDVSQYP